MATFVFFLVLIAFIKQGKLSKRLTTLEWQLQQINRRLDETSTLRPTPIRTTPLSTPAQVSTTPTQVSTTPAQAPSTQTPTPAPELPQITQHEYTSQPIVTPSSQFRKQLQWLEQQFIENWTGIIGSIILVAGVTFLGGYVGLRVSPFFRFLMIVGAAALLASGSYVVNRLKQWKPLAIWLRSCSAAVFLFACFASYAIPGIRWVATLVPTLGLLFLGIAVNLYVAYTASTFTFASLHVVLSLVPIILVPQSNVTILLATLITATGLSLGRRSRWDLHRLITLMAHAVFHIAWYIRILANVPAPSLSHQLVGAGSALFIAGYLIVMHYRSARTLPRITSLPFMVHIINWLLLASALIAYTGNTPVRGMVLLFASVIIYSLARYARRLGIRWIYLTDTLVAQTIALIGVVSFYPFVFHWLLIPAASFVLAALYLKLAIDENETLLERISVYLLHTATLVLAIAGLVTLTSNHPIRLQSAIILLTSALIGIITYRFISSSRSETYDSMLFYNAMYNGYQPVSLLSIGVGMITATAIANLCGSLWLAPVGFIASTLFVLLARRWQDRSLETSTWLLLLIAHLFAWLILYVNHPIAPVTQVSYYLVPLLLSTAIAGTFATVQNKAGSVLRSMSCYLMGLTVALGMYTLLQPFSVLTPGIMWLSLSLVALEIANRVKGICIPPALHLGYIYLSLFIGAYILNGLQTQAYLGPIPVRIVIEVYALATLVYWWLFRPNPELAKLRSWHVVHPLLMELVLLYTTTIVLIEVGALWRPLAWIMLALLTQLPQGGKIDSRLRFYSVLFYWASILDLVMVTSRFVTLSPYWYSQPTFTGLLAIIPQALYLYFVSQKLALNTIEFPNTLQTLERASKAIGSRQVLWLYYPFFVGMALFLYWRFEASMLTLLWSTESFIVLVLSLIIRENHFRYMAMAGLAACIVRLVIFDMAQTNLGWRGLVFIGVGGLMLLMNSLYNRYKDRLL